LETCCWGQESRKEAKYVHGEIRFVIYRCVEGWLSVSLGFGIRTAEDTVSSFDLDNEEGFQPRHRGLYGVVRRA
jgi:hypothetical protein